VVKIFLVARIVFLTLLVVTLAYFGAVRARWVMPEPWILASLVLALCAWLVGELAGAVALRARQKLEWVPFLGRASLALGALLVFAGGLANWAFSLRGLVILGEEEEAPFFHGQHLQEFESGPLSDVREMDLVLRLDRVKVEPAENGKFKPLSDLRLTRKGKAVHYFQLTPGLAVSDGTLKFHHGVFGYAPRIVITQGKETLFDKVVPFLTLREEKGQFVFIGEFTVSQYGLRVEGEVSLDSLDEDMRGHPSLAVRVERGGRVLGSGVLSMGHFAELAEGHRVGFAGLKRWAEIDISRKYYPQPMIAGASLFALGVALFGMRAFRRKVGRH